MPTVLLAPIISPPQSLQLAGPVACLSSLERAPVPSVVTHIVKVRGNDRQMGVPVCPPGFQSILQNLVFPHSSHFMFSFFFFPLPAGLTEIQR